MKPEIKEMWVNALPNYKQGKKCLRDQDDEFCCLGVLCDIYVQTGNTEWDVYRPVNQEYGYVILGNTAFLPDEVVEWAGLDSENPSFINSEHSEADNEGKVFLSALNDRGYTFEEIKQVIAKHF